MFRIFTRQSVACSLTPVKWVFLRPPREKIAKKRNISDYERADTISASDVEEMGSLAEKLRMDFEAWIQKTTPN